jgi:hypothetical protein
MPKQGKRWWARLGGKVKLNQMGDANHPRRYPKPTISEVSHASSTSAEYRSAWHPH